MPAYSILTTQGDLLIGGIAGVDVRLPGNASETRKFLLSAGDGDFAAAPSWDQIGIDDVDGLTAALSGKAPTTHTHAQSDITDLVSTLAIKADLVDGVIPTSQIPAIAITEFLGAVDSEEEMLELVGQRGDYCYRTDLQAALWLINDEPGEPESWLQVALPSVSVQSVNGQTGAVVLGYADVGAAASAHTHVISDVTGLQTAIDAKASLSGATFTGPVVLSPLSGLPLTINLPSGHSGLSLEIKNSDAARIFSVNSVGRVDWAQAAAGNLTWTALVSGDSSSRIQVRADGRLEFGGGGVGGADVRLRRSATSTLAVETTAGTPAPFVVGTLTASGGITPAALADSAASNNSIYFSTTASKLVYKDSGGSVHALY